jgi:hypothetical protein
MKTETTDSSAEYRGMDADARAAQIRTTLGTAAETLVNVVWLLRYTTVKHNIRWPTHAELMEMRHDG